MSFNRITTAIFIVVFLMSSYALLFDAAQDPMIMKSAWFVSVMGLMIEAIVAMRSEKGGAMRNPYIHDDTRT